MIWNHDLKLNQNIFTTFSFLEQLNIEEINIFLTQVQQTNWAKDRSIYLEGDFCHSLPLIISGSVRIYKLGENGREITLYHLGKGDSCILTASCIMSQKDFPAFAVTETDVEAIIIPANSLRTWVMQNSIWQAYIFGLLSQRLADVIEIVEEVAFRRMDCRIASYLLEIGNTSTETVQKTHQEIAQELGSSREVISRILKTFEKKELLSLSRKMIQLNNREKLKVVAKFGIS